MRADRARVGETPRARRAQRVETRKTNDCKVPACSIFSPACVALSEALRANAKGHVVSRARADPNARHAVARRSEMALSDDFAKVQLQAAAATKDLSLDPRLGACRAHAPRAIARERSPLCHSRNRASTSLPHARARLTSPPALHPPHAEYRTVTGVSGPLVILDKVKVRSCLRTSRAAPPATASAARRFDRLLAPARARFPSFSSSLPRLTRRAAPFSPPPAPPIALRSRPSTPRS